MCTKYSIDTLVESSCTRVCLAMKRTPAQARCTSGTQLRFVHGAVVFAIRGDGKGSVSSGSQWSVEPS